jgi:DNA-directed RNA polymerase beta subunit
MSQTPTMPTQSVLQKTQGAVQQADPQDINPEVDMSPFIDICPPGQKKAKLHIGDYSIDQADLFMVGDAELDANGLVNHHISSANDLYTNGIPQIITQVFKVDKTIYNQRDSTPEDKLISHIHVLIKFTDVFISRPTTVNYFSGKEEVLYPNVALREDKTYSANLRVNATIKATAHFKNGTSQVREDEIKNFKLCRVPVLVKSVLCNTHGCSKEALMSMNEDPTDPGGYFIIKGIEWVIDCIENILFNQIRVFKNEGYSKEVMRVEFVSKPGDGYQNSDYFIARLLNDNQLTCEILRNQLKGLSIPFYLLFRLLGCTDDKTMFDHILYGYDSNISKNMLNYVVECVNAKYNALSDGRYAYNQEAVMRLIADELKYTEFKYLDLDAKPENYQIVYDKIAFIVDTYFLPHVGLTKEDRPKKIRYLGLVIRKLFLVKMGNMEQCDRDSYKSKRIHAAGTGYAKTFKTYFNASIIQQIKRRLAKDFKAMTFSQVDLASSVKSSVYGADFERSIMQTITSGNKSQITVGKKARTNRLSSQLLDKSNQIATYATLRQVTTTSADSSKQSERASEMRRVHTSFLGYICIIHSTDGEKVGINKQLAIFADILGATSSGVLKNMLLADKDVYPLDKAPPATIFELNLRNVYVNGDWIGCTRNTTGLVSKYRAMRRASKINPTTTIHWDNTQNEVFFWVDVGRPVRPLMIVYNNKRDPEHFTTKYKSANGKSNFTQGLGITAKTIADLRSKKIDMNYLLCNNIVEYITPEEQENYYLCPFFDQLRDNKNDELHAYTHCDIPQSILGITALTSPFANHNQTPRITFQTSQCKQTCGVFALNWPYRCDKDTFLQYVCETPLVKTVATKYIFPNGSNTIVAIQCYTGYNVEDSIIVSQGAVDRGLFDGSKFTFAKTELEQREDFGNPDVTTTSNIKTGSYAKLTNGIVARGTRLKGGDAVIGKFMRTPKTADQDMDMVDRSIIYKSKEEAIVHNVIVNRNEDDEQFCKVSLRKPRSVCIGDKFCLTPDHEVLTSAGWKPIATVSYSDRVATLNPSTHEVEYQHPTDVPSFNHAGIMYNIKSANVDFVTTLNHKMYVRDDHPDAKYNLVEAHAIKGKRVFYKKDCRNAQRDIDHYQLPAHNNQQVRNFPMDAWLSLIGVFMTKGFTSGPDTIHLNRATPNQRVILLNALHAMGIKPTATHRLTVCDAQLVAGLTCFGTPRHPTMPDLYRTLSLRQSNILLLAIMHAGSSHVEHFTQSKGLVDIIQTLAIMSGQTAIVKPTSGAFNALHYHVCVSNDTCSAEPSSCDALSVETLTHYKGFVHCITVPNHIFMVRRNFIHNWTGNSSRAGQKGVCGVLLRDSDMPATAEGIRPELIINPHAIPSRMTCGQLFESQLGNWCAMKGTHANATIFQYTDIESIGDELESMGLNRHGYHRLYSGITGEYIDAMIFMGPTYYQRLQKFVIDSVYSISQCATDAITHQPLDGKSNNGGMKIGEMEKDVIVASGSSKFLREKFFSHSDGFTEYICRCGKAAVVNVKKNIYKCKYCKDNADIAAIPTSSSSRLFTQEMETMNVGVRRHLTPFVYESLAGDAS